jgi:hypothetical protein
LGSKLTDYEGKKNKKPTKAQAKIAKTGAKTAKAEAKARVAEAEIQAASKLPGFGRLPHGVGIAVHKKEGGSDLVVSGLTDDQLKRILPQINKEVLITVTEDTNTLRAGVMRFLREGVFQTIIKIIAGLVVGYLLFKFGLI